VSNRKQNRRRGSRFLPPSVEVLEISVVKHPDGFACLTFKPSNRAGRCFSAAPSAAGAMRPRRQRQIRF
jgi:hypothetical protein